MMVYGLLELPWIVLNLREVLCRQIQRMGTYNGSVSITGGFMLPSLTVNHNCKYYTGSSCTMQSSDIRV